MGELENFEPRDLEREACAINLESGIPKRGRPNGVALILILSDLQKRQIGQNLREIEQNRRFVVFQGLQNPSENRTKSAQIRQNRTFSACPHSAVPFGGPRLKPHNENGLRAKSSKKAIFREDFEDNHRCSEIQ